MGRNSWSFTGETALKSPSTEQHPQQQYVDPEGMFNNSDLKCGSRARLRQRSISNLTTGVKSREHAAGTNNNCNNNRQGTISKGVDYIRMNPSTMRPLTSSLSS